MGSSNTVKLDMEQLFKDFDINKSGAIDSLEIAQYMKLHYPQYPVQIISLLISLVDKNHNNLIDKEEFKQFYKIVQASISELEIKQIIYAAVSHATGSTLISCEKVSQVLNCLEVIDPPSQFTQQSYNKDEFINEISKYM
ncbi:EF-hand_domain [Hexamita inflata]|uniref:EF-hand domain n=1 Tax=Hexamita inflata TaxID=28002 RepID=A0AA86VDH8_9EUKA|nr:EF-hand domain [Hexamita inflata]